MNSRCLYCDKRLSLFHGKKKPFCSDDHEDLYVERQAVSGLDRLRDDTVVFKEGTGPVRPVKPSLPPAQKPPEQFAYPELEPGFFDEDPEPAPRAAAQIFSRPPQHSADGIPPPADYLISSANAVQPAAPAIPFRDPARAAFLAVPWTRPIHLEGVYSWPTPVPTQTAPLLIEPEKSDPPPPPLVTSLERLPMPLFSFPDLHASVDTSKISALPDEPHRSSLPRLETEPLEVGLEPEPPAMVTTPAPVQTLAVRLADPDTSRTFRDYTLDVAVPRLIYPPPHRAPRFEAEARPAEAPPVVLTPQAGQVDPLPQPQPLRLRTLLDLRGSAFRTTTLRLAPAPLAHLSWNAAPPETVLWPLATVRRRPAPVLPKLNIYDYQST